MTDKQESNFLRHEACPTCGSSDGRAVYDDLHSFCFVCETHYPAPLSTTETHRVEEEEVAITDKTITPLFSVYRGIPKRGLTSESLERYQIGVNLDKSIDVAHVYP